MKETAWGHGIYNIGAVVGDRMQKEKSLHLSLNAVTFLYLNREIDSIIYSCMEIENRRKHKRCMKGMQCHSYLC